MAAFGNLLFPGLGHLLLGKPFRALLWAVAVVVGYFCWLVPGLVLHLVCIIAGAKLSQKLQVEAVAQGVRRAEARR